MTGLIYSIKVNELVYSRLQVLDVKIGKTTNINSILSQYKRSHMVMEILDLWKPNEALQLSDCERAVHKLAERYAYERDSEKFIFLQNAYKTFSEHVSLFLEKTTSENEVSGVSSYKKSKQQTGKLVDYTGKIPKAIVFKNQAYQVRYWRDVLSVISKKIYEEKKDDFAKVLQMKAWFSKDGRKRKQGGPLRFPMKITDSPYYFEGNISANQSIRLIHKLFTLFGYNSSDMKIECL
jgi:hypothetical protein